MDEVQKVYDRLVEDMQKMKSTSFKGFFRELLQKNEVLDEFVRLFPHVDPHADLNFSNTQLLRNLVNVIDAHPELDNEDLRNHPDFKKAAQEYADAVERTLAILVVKATQQNPNKVTVNSKELN